MANQFYVGQRVRSEKYGEGEVLNVSSNRHPGFPVYCSFKNSGMGYSLAGVLIGGSDIDLTPIDPPRTVMTDWQRKRLRTPGVAMFTKDQIDLIESILSEPEPPKFIPKEGEVCLFRDKDETTWVADRLCSIDNREYFVCQFTHWKQCRPFSLELIGTTDNPQI